MTLKEFKSRYDSNKLQYVFGKKTYYPYPMKDEYGMLYKINNLFERWDGVLECHITFKGGVNYTHIYENIKIGLKKLQEDLNRFRIN